MEIYNGNWTVYIHTNKINGKQYVGITSTDPTRRWGFNGRGYKGCVKLTNAIAKYGWDNFDHEIFASNLTEEEACNTEKLLIQKFDTINNGYNQEPGGKGGAQSEEAKQKIREARLKQIFTPEALAKKAASHVGLKRTKETKVKQREAARGRFKPVVCLETGERFETLTDAARAKEVSIASVYNSCERYKASTTTRKRGWHWKFA